MSENNNEAENYGSVDITIKNKTYHFVPNWKKPKQSLIYFAILFGVMAGLMLAVTGIVYGLWFFGYLITSALFSQKASMDLLFNGSFFAGVTITAMISIIFYGWIFSYNKEPKSDKSSATVKLP
jgi:hypothetical protein